MHKQAVGCLLLFADDGKITQAAVLHVPHYFPLHALEAVERTRGVLGRFVRIAGYELLQASGRHHIDMAFFPGSDEILLFAFRNSQAGRLPPGAQTVAVSTLLARGGQATRTPRHLPAGAGPRR